MLQQILDAFEVHGEGRNHEDKFVALTQALDDIERQHCANMTAIYEQEASVDPDAVPQAPSFGSRAMSKIGQLVSSGQVAPRFMLKHRGWFSSGDTRDLLVKWVTCRQEIAVRAEEMGNYLNHQGKIVDGIGIIGNVCDCTRWAFDVATIVPMVIPATGNISGIMGLTSTAMGTASGIVYIVTAYVAKCSAINSERSLFQMMAQENALHRMAYFALHGDADVETEDLPLDEMPSDAILDDKHLQMGASAIVNLISNSSNLITDSLILTAAIQSFIMAGQAWASPDGSGNGDQLKSLAKEYAYDGKSPEEVADLMLADPKRYVVPPPPGIVIFDLKDTTLHVRMVVREKRQTQYFDTQSPITLSGKRCEVSFQVRIRGIWKDVNEWNATSRALVVPLKKQVYRLNGQKDFRWFHLEGPYPVRVVGVDDENGPMQ